MGIRIALTAAVAAAALAPADRIGGEFARLAAEIPRVVPADASGAVLQRLERGRTAHDAAQMYLALYDLQVAFEAEAGYRLAATAKSFADHAAFTTKWKELGEPDVHSARKAGVVFVEALAQSAAGRAPATYRASLPYARDAGVMAGLYYLGESHAMARFAELCRSLDLESPAPAPRLGSIEPALSAYEREVVKAYDTAEAAKRPQYAAVNVAIKLARTLDEHGQHEGALLQYLVSRYRLRLVQSSSSPADLDRLKARIAATTMPASADHSIGEFFLQLASFTVTTGEPAASGAASILDDILPAYFAVVGK